MDLTISKSTNIFSLISAIENEFTLNIFFVDCNDVEKSTLQYYKSRGKMNASSEIISPHCALLASVVSGYGESRYHIKSNAIFNAFKVRTKNLVTFIWRYM